VRSDDVRGKQFSTHWLWEGYDKKQVDAFLDAAAIRLAAMESRDRPAEPLLVSGATLVAWAEWADSATFTKPRIGHGKGYTPEEVDAFRKKFATLSSEQQNPQRSSEEGLDKGRAARSGGRYPMASAARISPHHRPKGSAAMTRSRFTRYWMPPASGWPRWSRWIGRQGHWLAKPFSPGGPRGPTQRHSQPAVGGTAMTKRRSMPSSRLFAMSSSSGEPL
jgi:DivIVA domain-containing protein